MKLPPLVIDSNLAVMGVPIPGEPTDNMLVTMRLGITNDPTQPQARRELEIALETSTARDIARQLLEKAQQADHMYDLLKKPKH